MKVYLDNCCYNRPYDDQSQMRICLETQAKLFIQELIRNKKLELVTSFVLDYENSCNRITARKEMIKQFMEDNSSIYVGKTHLQEIREKATIIQTTGVKEKDALHVSCAIFGKCDYFISTDDRLLKYHSDDIRLVTPVDFISIWEA